MENTTVPHKIIFKTLTGSRTYGTSTPASDEDYKGVYILSVDDLVSSVKEKRDEEQIEVGKDEVYYEVRKFLRLALTANPTILEMLYMPDKFVVINSPQFKLIQEHKDVFLTKKCRNSFGGYALEQVKKARGLDKKMNWEKEKVTRKTPIDFCHVYEDGKTFSLKSWLNKNDKKQEFCGLIALNHFRDCYALYYDFNAHFGSSNNFKFKGIAFENSNQICLSSIPKGLTALTIIFYNKDGYSQHCRDFKDYTTWLKNRNTQRYVDLKGHNQKIDGKNLLHCRRMIETAIEIAKEKTINVERPNADYLLKIRRGEVSLEDIIKQSEEDILLLDELFKNSDLPDDVDENFVNDLLLQIRKM